MSLLKSIKQQLGLGPAAENHFWDGSVANQLTLKRGTPDVPGATVMQVVNGVLQPVQTGPAFKAIRDAADVLPANSPVVVNNFTEEFDTDNAFNPTTGVFAPQVAGYYQINGHAVCQNAIANIGIYARIVKNGSVAEGRGGGTCNTATFGIASASTIVYANGTTDYFSLQLTFTALSGTGTVGDIAFSAALIRKG